jgi:hypothetical protein
VKCTESRLFYPIISILLVILFIQKKRRKEKNENKLFYCDWIIAHSSFDLFRTNYRHIGFVVSRVALELFLRNKYIDDVSRKELSNCCIREANSGGG